jgi:predicted metallopeptidase
MIHSSINLTDTLSLITHEMIIRTPEFRGYDINRMLICCASNRSDSRGGIYGKLVPLKFEGGSDIINFHGRTYTIPKIIHNNIEIRYLIYYYHPKFFDISAREKVNVMFHELYHISPDFNGDIRRMGKFKKAHGHSKKSIEEKYLVYAEEFYRYVKETPYHAFLEMSSRDLQNSFKKIKCRRMKTIKPVPVEAAQKR